MSQEIMMIYINITNFVQISLLGRDHTMTEMRRLKSVAIFLQTILSFVLPRKIIKVLRVFLKEKCFSSFICIGKNDSTCNTFPNFTLQFFSQK